MTVEMDSRDATISVMHGRSTTLGAMVFAVAAVLLGGVLIAFGDFVGVWHPVPGSKTVRRALAYIVGAAAVGSGMAILARRHVAAAGLVLTAAFFCFGAFWTERVYNHAGLFGVWAGVCEQWATAMGGVTIWAWSAKLERELRGRILHAARVVFGVCAIAFGISHFSAVAETAKLVPAWLWPGQRFWAEFTGCCHMLAGLAIVTGENALVAARLECTMMLGFGLLVWLPALLAQPADQIAWGGNAVNLGLAGAAWVIADSFKLGREAKPPLSQEARP